MIIPEVRYQRFVADLGMLGTAYLEGAAGAYRMCHAASPMDASLFL